jgi:YD repeat-containing protein
MTQDARTLPAGIVEGSVQSRDYYYDGVGNVTAITDQLAAHPDSVLMSYCDRPRQRLTE